MRQRLESCWACSTAARQHGSTAAQRNSSTAAQRHSRTTAVRCPRPALPPAQQLLRPGLVQLRPTGTPGAAGCQGCSCGGLLRGLLRGRRRPRSARQLQRRQQQGHARRQLGRVAQRGPPGVLRSGVPHLHLELFEGPAEGGWGCMASGGRRGRRGGRQRKAAGDAGVETQWAQGRARSPGTW
jgi:hypothetical protein